jgi:phosphoglycolate phosphatase-like HAD superfamily hydrolase
VASSRRDIQTARNAGLRSVLVRTGVAGADGVFAAEPDAVCANVLEAARLILAEDGGSS